MFFNTHVYYSKRVDNNLDPLKIVGSFLPDLAITGVITWDNLHRKKNILEFFEYVEKNNPEYKSLIKGINYHNSLDYYTHIEYKNLTPGYAYANITDKMTDLIEKALNVDSERAKTTSHNFIECGVDFHLLHDEPSLKNLVRTSIKKIDKDKLAKLLADFYKKDEKVMQRGLSKLFSFASEYDFKTLDGWLKFWIEANRFYLKKETDRKLTKEALVLSFKLTKNTYREFIEYSIASKDTSIKDAN